MGFLAVRLPAPLGVGEDIVALDLGISWRLEKGLSGVMARVAVPTPGEVT